MLDQAKALREKIQKKQKEKKQRNTRVVAVTSGKGGGGKSNFALNFAICLVRRNHKVLIFDVDLSFTNIDVLLGRSPRETIVSMLEKDLSITDIMEEGPEGLKFISGGTGFSEVFHMGEGQLTKFFTELSSLHGEVDYIILDTGAGLSQENLRFILASDDVILVTTPEPTSITDAYAVVKMVTLKKRNLPIKLLINQCTNDKEGEQTATNFKKVAEEFLNRQIEILGYIPEDRNVSMAVRGKVPLLTAFPKTAATLAMEQVTCEFLQLPVPYKLGIRGFLLKLMLK